ncbi:AbrB family transcriptional regulator [Teichococcus vastitatis]|uniref:AbrB family transcriptional regulator n=1 Tax=Teichococcus vastitatis TaxID=2307076 RepID=A0ABS9W0S1_9PROT|nr:AbrB family transcriptional regulator [Pseudoroseomonas vastitatis]MCI0752896.1 AbrB family transcriptional regulator [Pseudoroseomonas vastitatis]
MFRRLLQARPPSLAHWPPAGRWAVLLLLSALLMALLNLLGLPAALLLAAMAAGILVAVAEGRLQVGAWPFALAQGIIGCMIARSLHPEVLVELVADWPVFLAGVLSVLAVSSLLGWLLARRQVLPGTTAIWGSSPGAAAAMMLMAEAHGADVRLVAFMLYLRVVLVAGIASLVARFWAQVPSGGVAAAPVPWFPTVPWGALGLTLLVGLGGAALAKRLRIPAGPLLVPMFAAALLQGFGLMVVELPPWLLAVSYAAIGWSIGLRFTRPILAHAARAFPRLLASTLALIAACGVLAAVLSRLLGVDPLTAYLATSPGGADSVAIIAATSAVDLPFIMAMQMARFMVVLLTGPAIARFFARRLPPNPVI